LNNLISDDGCNCSISWHYYVNAAEQHRGMFIQTLTEKSIAIKNMRVKIGMDVKDDNGSKELVDLRNRNTFLLYDKCIYVSLVSIS